MLETLRSFAVNLGEILLVFAGFALIERARPAERGQRFAASVFNVEYLFLYQLINLLLLPALTALVVDRLRAVVPSAFGFIRADGLLDGAWKTVAFFFVYDFFYYWFHRLQHRWPFLWSQHKLHHSEESLNATTTFRHHWLEDLLRVFLIVLPMSLAFDLKPASAGAAAFVVGLWPVFIHANLRLHLGPFARVIAGPQGHRIHHSVEPAHLDRNLAAFFPLWDQLFGTYYHPRRDDYPRTGLASGQKVTSLAQAFWLPFAEWFAPKPSADPARVHARRVAIAAWGVAIFLGLALLEVAARIVFPLPAIGNFNRIEYALTAISPSMRNKHYLMNSTLAWTSEPDHAGSTMHLNLYGFRDAQWDVLHKRARRILFVGDSFVEGFMVADDETIPAVFARRARADGKTVEVFNLGIGAAGLSDYMKVIQDAVPALKPDEIVLVFYANDFAGEPPFTSERVRAPFEPRYRPAWLPRIAQVTRRLISGEPVALRWHGEPKPFLAAVPDPTNPWTTRAAELAPKVEPEIADAMRRATFNPHAVDELAEYAYQFQRVVDVTTHLTFLRDFLAARNVSLRLAYLPYPAQVSDYYVPFKHRFGGRSVTSMSGPEFQVQAAHIAQVAKDLGLPFLDLTPQLRARDAAGERLYWDYDHHFRPAGYTFATNALYDWAAATTPPAPPQSPAQSSPK